MDRGVCRVRLNGETRPRDKTPRKIRAAGYRVANVDVTVVLERPKLSPHADAIRARLAPVLGVAADAVSVKAKTNEGVDAVGRGEAIAAHAVAMIAATGDAS